MFPFGDCVSHRRVWAPFAVLALAIASLTLTSGAGVAAPTARPSNTAEPVISGRAEQGRTLSASRGRWSGTGSLSYAYRWVRCGANGGRPDGSDCGFILGATRSSYEVASADVGFRLRVRVTARNAEGEQTAASNPTAVVAGPPVNTSIPLVGGTALVDSVATVHPGSWTGRQPISYTYAWLRCNGAGGECAAIAGASGRSYRLTTSDVNHRMRVSVTARNAVGSATVLSGESGIVSVPLPAGAIRLGTGEISIPATSVSADQRLIVSRVAFAPNPVTTRQRPLTVRVRVVDTRSYVVRDAVVFVRATPRVTTGGRLLTATDGWVTFRLQPLGAFPLRKQGHVQFFVKAYRSGDPALGGVAGYRLVQVRTTRA
ncbi:MAG: hypothetical protein H0U00_14360 [Actinobacteria bacterium]|nr:hypothetical protein [Actinomycetota bacterium]